MTMTMNKLDLVYDGIANCHSLRKTMSDLLAIPELTDSEILRAIDYWRASGPYK